MTAATSVAGTQAGTGSVRHPLDPDRRIRGVLFDLDGTLYSQPPVRLLMAAEMLTLPLIAPSRAASIIRALRSYRHAQEALRGHESSTPLDAAQVAVAAERAGLPHDEVAAIVDEWMIRRPLKYLRRCVAPGAHELVALLHREGVHVGLFSDYPAHEKIGALGLADRFSPVLCSSDPGINRFKPDPRGFLAAAAAWQLPPSDVLMIGDRYEVDFAGARAAGMPCVLVGNPRHVPSADAAAVFPSLERLARVLDRHHA
ncbi:MAG: HAD family hydrolase [Vicinamibacterales bacterium]